MAHHRTTRHWAVLVAVIAALANGVQAQPIATASVTPPARIDTALRGNVLATINVAGYGACQAECKRVGGCTGYTFVGGGAAPVLLGSRNSLPGGAARRQPANCTLLGGKLDDVATRGAVSCRMPCEATALATTPSVLLPNTVQRGTAVVTPALASATPLAPTGPVKVGPLPVKPMTLGAVIPPAPPPPAPPAPAPASITPILVGTGTSDITGPVAEVVMMGYANGDQVATGLSQRLYARAFIFANQGGKRVVFVSAELGQLFGSIKQGVLRQLAARYGNLYDDRNVQLSATHTHAGPAGYAHHAIFNFSSYGFVVQNYNVIVDGITKAIVQAHESLAPATVSIGTGNVNQASVNRSLSAFQANADAAGASPINSEMTLIRLDRPAGPAGVISWFSVHNTSLTRTNRYVSSDHKGYAAYLFEKSQGTIQPLQESGKFVAAFANGDEGDQSPNIVLPQFKGPGSGTEFDAMRIIGEREFGAASAIFNGHRVPVRGDVDFRHSFVQMPGLLVAANQVNGAGGKVLCNAAYGFSFAAGAEDGPSGAPGFTEGMTIEKMNASRSNDLANFFKGNLLPIHLRAALTAVSPAAFNDACQRPKPVLIPSSTLGWTPDILPFQLIRVGNVVIAGVPGEMTVQAGRRLRTALQSSLWRLGITHVILTGLANDYSGYIATREEYDTQQYEGASTLFGRLTLDAYLQIFGKLAAEMASGVPSAPGPMPPDLSQGQIALQTGVVYDDKRVIEVFGQTMLQPPASVQRGGTVEVSFRAGHPKNKLNTGWSYYFIERQVPSGTWAAQVWDSMPEGRMTWRRDKAPDCLACSFVDVRWDVPLTAIPGTYRITHNGAWKNGWDGAIKPYQGVTRTFIVR